MPPAAAAAAVEPRTAAAVLGELQLRYAKWRQRNYNYSRLLAFLSFIALLLGVLFLQRGSHTSFEVRARRRQRRVAARLPWPAPGVGHGPWSPARAGFGAIVQRMISGRPSAMTPRSWVRCRRCTARWRQGCCPQTALLQWTTSTPGCTVCWRRCGATPCAATACARALLSMPSMVSILLIGGLRAHDTAHFAVVFRPPYAHPTRPGVQDGLCAAPTAAGCRTFKT